MLVKKYAVYMHCRKDNGVPFYIGCCSRHDNTRNVGDKKYRRAFDFKQRRRRWFDVVADAGGVDVEIVFTSNDKQTAFSMERDLVDTYGRENFNNGMLVNECLGGEGAPGQYNSIETRRKKSLQQTGYSNSMYGKEGANARSVVDTVTGVKYRTVSIAADALGHNMKTLYNWLSGHRKNPTNLRFS